MALLISDFNYKHEEGMIFCFLEITRKMNSLSQENNLLRCRDNVFSVVLYLLYSVLAVFLVLLVKQ